MKYALFFLNLFCLTVPAYAADNARHLTYEVYAGGVNALTASVELDLAGKAGYGAAVTARTQGLLGHLAPWQGSFATQGWRLKNNAWQPHIYRSASTWQGKEEVKQFTYDKDGSFKGFQISEAGQNTSPPKIDSKLAAGTTDALSATIAIMDQVARTGSCAGSDDVFDGLRRFKLVFHEGGRENMSASNYNGYSGPALRCTVEVVPDGGRWHEKPRGWLSIQEQGRRKGSLPTIWFAPVLKDGPALPVKIRVVTDYGTLFMQLSHY